MCLFITWSSKETPTFGGKAPITQREWTMMRELAPQHLPNLKAQGSSTAACSEDLLFCRQNVHEQMRVFRRRIDVIRPIVTQHGRSTMQDLTE
jgi:hypothetical protein